MLTFTAAARRRQFLAGRWLLRCLLAAGVRQAAESLRLAMSEAGRSLSWQGWSLALSHGGDWLAAVVDEAPVGIDLQHQLPRHDWRAMAAFAGLEPPESAADFYRHWTLAEAWLKADPACSSLAQLSGLRWRRSITGPGWQGQVGDLHWAVVAEQAPQWRTDLFSGCLVPAEVHGWAPVWPAPGAEARGDQS